MAKIFISTSSFGKEDEMPLRDCKKGNEVVLNPFGRVVMGQELLELAGGCDGIIAGTEVIDRGLLEKLPRLKVISRCGVGLDNIDLEAAGEFGIKVYSVTSGVTLAVAELTVALILNLLRKVSLMDRAMRDNLWQKKMGSLLNGKNVGIIGFGRIGRKVAELIAPFGSAIAYFDIQPVKAPPHFSFKQLPDLLVWSDILTIHCSAPNHCKQIIGEKELGGMKKGAWLINVSRGGVVDEEGLYKYLKSGSLSGAAIDVFEKEPYKGKLSELDNIILTPHIGSYARESRIEMEKEAVDNLLKGLRAVKGGEK